jgi:AraC-like DNA-binding protein
MNHVLSFGFTFSLVLAVAQGVRKKPELPNYLNSAIFTCNAVLQLGVLLIALRVPVRCPWSIVAFLSSIFFIGPLIYYYNYILINPSSFRERLQGMQIAHLVPGFIVLAAEIIFQLFPNQYKITVLDAALNGTEWNPIAILCLAGSIHASLYFLYMFIQGLSVRDVESVRVPLLIMSTMYLACMVSVITVACGFFIKSDNVLYSGGAMVPAINTIIFLANNRYPKFFKLIESEIKKKKYERSLLYGIDTSLLGERLNELMADKSIYNDFDITLEKLSEMLFITQHQLSQFLNEKLNTNFRQYINSYRIEEAKNLLVGNPGQSIISICFKVGFGSKSAFNDIFKKFTGENPSDYRERHLEKPGAE